MQASVKACNAGMLQGQGTLAARLRLASSLRAQAASSFSSMARPQGLAAYLRA